MHRVEDALVVKLDLPEMGERCGDVVLRHLTGDDAVAEGANRRAHGLPPCAFLLPEFGDLPTRFHASIVRQGQCRRLRVSIRPFDDRL
jgi:hypothetical protein